MGSFKKKKKKKYHGEGRCGLDPLHQAPRGTEVGLGSSQNEVNSKKNQTQKTIKNTLFSLMDAELPKF